MVVGVVVVVVVGTVLTGVTLAVPVGLTTVVPVAVLVVAVFVLVVVVLVVVVVFVVLVLVAAVGATPAATVPEAAAVAAASGVLIPPKTPNPQSIPTVKRASPSNPRSAHTHFPQGSAAALTEGPWAYVLTDPTVDTGARWTVVVVLTGSTWGSTTSTLETVTV